MWNNCREPYSFNLAWGSTNSDLNFEKYITYIKAPNSIKLFILTTCTFIISLQFERAASNSKPFADRESDNRPLLIKMSCTMLYKIVLIFIMSAWTVPEDMKLDFKANQFLDYWNYTIIFWQICHIWVYMRNCWNLAKKTLSHWLRYSMPIYHFCMIDMSLWFKGSIWTSVALPYLTFHRAIPA